MGIFNKKTPTITDGSKFSYEEKYGLLIDNIKKFLACEDDLASGANTNEAKSVYDAQHPCYDLFASIYANLFNEEMRMEVDKILDNQLREMQIKRIRNESLVVYTLCGKSFVDQLITNCIDGIVGISGVTGVTSRVLRRELEMYFAKRPILWYCIAAVGLYATGLTKTGLANKQKASALLARHAAHT